NQAKLAAKIKVYYSIKNGQRQFIDAVLPDSDGLASLNFKQPSEGNGYYSVIAEAELWSGQTKTSPPLGLIIKGLK
ncbi:MAG TPA: hypothetical protein PLP46_02885, partial [bacterium]|nr:hypothetical protein [bacterium]